MYVLTPQSAKKQPEFFRTNVEPMADDEPMDEPTPTAKPLEHAQSLEPKNDRKLLKLKPALENIKKGCPKKRTRRGYGKKNNRKNIKGVKNVNFTLLGTNANGILGKQESLKSLINKFKPCVITVQEGKQGKKGLLKLKGYQIFERVRLSGQGGGLLTAVDQDLLPVLVSTSDDDEAEVISVQVKF